MTILFLNASKMEETPSYCVGDCSQIEKNPEPSIEEFGGSAKYRKDSLRSFFVLKYLQCFLVLMPYFGSKIIG